MTEKERHTVEAILLGVFLLIIPTAAETRQDGNYLSIAQWWNEGARFRQECHCGDYIRDCFWGDDWIGNLCHSFFHWVAGYTIPLWNNMTASWYGQAILGLITLIAGSAICDLLKALWKKIHSDQPKQ